MRATGSPRVPVSFNTYLWGSVGGSIRYQALQGFGLSSTDSKDGGLDYLPLYMLAPRIMERF